MTGPDRVGDTEHALRQVKPITDQWKHGQPTSAIFRGRKSVWLEERLPEGDDADGILHPDGYEQYGRVRLNVGDIRALINKRGEPLAIDIVRQPEGARGDFEHLQAAHAELNAGKGAGPKAIVRYIMEDPETRIPRFPVFDEEPEG